MTSKNYMLMYYILYTLSVMVLLIYFVPSKFVSSVEWILWNNDDITISLLFNINQNSIIFSYTVLVIFASVFHYSLFYLEKMGIKRFMITLSLFVVSMMILISSGNLFTSLIGWDGLGISSMMLIMYYCSNASLKASVYTFIINRLGDCLFLIVMLSSFCTFPSLYPLGCDSFDMGIIVSTLLVMLSMTKSAQIPFSTWLTKAMEAPTPVSSLVHSSTLVTAGIYMLFLYQDMWKSFSSLSFFLMVTSLSTMFWASLSGLTEMDMKKTVAYSTLSQLGFIMFSFSLSMFDQGFFHLIMHAYFKAMMFMSVGYVIHHSSGWQDLRSMTLNYSCSPGITKLLITSVMALCGMPYLTGFYSKDLIMDFLLINNYSINFMIFMIISFFLTAFYSFRICWFLCKGYKSLNLVSDDSSKMLKSMTFLFVNSCVMGSIISWSSPSMICSSDSPKISITLCMVLMIFMFWYFFSFIKMGMILKKNFFFYIIISMIASKFYKVVELMYWNLELTSLMGKVVGFPSYMNNKIEEILSKKFNLMMILNESFVLLSLIMVMIVFF